jgi:hypothetical protein
MRFRVWKPLHNWRQFAGEVAIIASFKLMVVSFIPRGARINAFLECRLATKSGPHLAKRYWRRRRTMLAARSGQLPSKASSPAALSTP